MYERVSEPPKRGWELKDLQILIVFVAWIDFVLLVGIVSVNIDKVFAMIDQDIDRYAQHSDLMVFGVFPFVLIYNFLINLAQGIGIFNCYSKVFGIALAHWCDIFKLFIHSILLHLVMSNSAREGCNPGRFLDYGQCQPCQVSFFKTSFGEQGCQRCPYNLSSLGGSVDCKPCHELYDPGYIYEESTGGCFKFIREEECPRYMTFAEGQTLGKASDCRPNCDRFFMGYENHTMWYYLEGECLFIPDQDCINVTRCPVGQTSLPHSSSAQECFSV